MKTKLAMTDEFVWTGAYYERCAYIGIYDQVCLFAGGRGALPLGYPDEETYRRRESDKAEDMFSRIAACTRTT